MCGIYFCVGDDQHEVEEFHKKHIDKLLSSRGPDNSRTIKKLLNGKCLLFHATVLHHQGNAICTQPVVDDNFILLFNGDLYIEIENGKSDTEYLFQLIRESENEQSLLMILSSLVGPFSVILKTRDKIYFARDALGRNSLLMGRKDETFFLTSVIDPGEGYFQVIELPPLGIFSIDLDSMNSIDLHPYRDINEHPHYQQQFEMIQRILPVNLHTCLPLMQSCDDKFSFDFTELCKNEKVTYDELLENEQVNLAVKKFIELLMRSVKDRIVRIQDKCKNCIKISSPCNHTKIGILFSGGVDCSLIALLTHKLLPENESIDLMNVSFEKVTNKQEKIDWNVPDRLTGLETLEELKKLCPMRNFNFIEINITRAELNENLKKLSSLVYPLCNILDESLGAALYFASRGRGLANEENYESQCRVLLIGSGADELFGGYTRHRNAFKRKTEDRDLLTEELTLDWVRLPSRNLARDDRVIGDNGITVRAPFIEENFVKFARNLSATQRCYPGLAEGVGDKLLLRLAAYQLGLKNCCTYKKRALQFGSRIADKRQKATDISKAFLR